MAGVWAKEASISAGGRNCAGASRSASLQPSNHSIVNGLPSEALTPGMCQTMCAAVGHAWSFTAGSASVCVSARTSIGARSFSSMPRQTADMRWQPMSPIQPEPRSRQMRQISGW